MKKRRLVLSLMVVQTVCTVCGLAFFYLYVHSAVRHHVEQQLFNSFFDRARQLAASIEKTVGSGNADAETLHKVLSQVRVSDEHVMLLDRQGQVKFDGGAAGHLAAAAKAEHANDLPTGSNQSLTWKRSSAAWGTFDAPIRGLIDGRLGVLAAVAHPVAAIDGYVLLAAAVDDQPVSMAELKPVLRMAIALALLWTTGLSVVAMYLLITNVSFEAPPKVEASVETLKNSQALMRTQESVIFGLAKLSDSRDSETGDHLERISYYCTTLAAALRKHPDFRNEITPTFVRLIGISSALHDIGKVGVEDAILRKPGPLTLEERELMARHTRIGEECLREIEHRLGTSNYLQMAREIAASHHERWDGTGYPEGLAGDQIPLAARIVAIADVYDALSSKRVYKLPLAHEQCVATIAAEGGKHFDPRLVDVFLEVEDRFRNINHQLQSAAAADESASGREPVEGELPLLAVTGSFE